MKKISKLLVLTFSVSLFAVNSGKAQILVPKPLVGTKTTLNLKRPNKYEVWVPEDWLPTDKRYIYHAGYWAFPPTSKSVYVPGYWVKTPKGYYRVTGYWKNPHV